MVPAPDCLELHFGQRHTCSLRCLSRQDALIAERVAAVPARKEPFCRIGTGAHPVHLGIFDLRPESFDECAHFRLGFETEYVRPEVVQVERDALKDVWLRFVALKCKDEIHACVAVPVHRAIVDFVVPALPEPRFDVLTGNRSRKRKIEVVAHGGSFLSPQSDDWRGSLCNVIQNIGSYTPGLRSLLMLCACPPTLPVKIPVLLFSGITRL